MSDYPIETKAKDDSKFNNGKSFIKDFIFVSQSTVGGKALHFYIFIIPLLHFLDSALKRIITEWNFPVLTIISNLECLNQSFIILVDFENNVCCIPRVGRHASIFIIFLSFFIGFINACCVCHIQTCKNVTDCSIMSTINDPLNIPFRDSPIDVGKSSFEES